MTPSSTDASARKPRVVSGMRPTGKLHLGHLVGALNNWSALQEQYDCFYFVADWHALTSDYADTSGIVDSAYQMVADWIAGGLDRCPSLGPRLDLDALILRVQAPETELVDVQHREPQDYVLATNTAPHITEWSHCRRQAACPATLECPSAGLRIVYDDLPFIRTDHRRVDRRRIECPIRGRDSDADKVAGSLFGRCIDRGKNVKDAHVRLDRKGRPVCRINPLD